MDNYEIERKYLITMPDKKVLAALAAERGGEVWNIVQVYLRSEPGENARVRRVESAGKVRYFRTEKKHVTDMKRIEHEWEIGGDEYLAAFADADPELKPVTKVRYRIPCGGLTWEIDVFPFWKHQAVLEVELPSEDAEFALPSFADVIREVTEEKAYTNHSLAKMIPEED